MNFKAYVIVHDTLSPPDEHELNLCKSRALEELKESSEFPVLVLDGGPLEQEDMGKIRLMCDTSSPRVEISQNRTALYVPLFT